MKFLRYIFIPFLAILIMSHNTFAVNFNYNVRLYDGKPVYSIVQGGHTYGNRVTGVAYNSSISITTNGSIAAYDGMLVDVPVFIYNYADNNATDGIWTPDYVTCNVTCQWVGFELQSSNAQTIVHNYIYVSGTGNLSSFVFRSANTNNVVFSLQSAQEELYVPIVLAYRFVDLSGGGSTPDLSTINTYIQYISAQLETIYTQLGAIDGSIPSASDIADAVNAPEEQAAEDISNQSTDDIDSGDDSSATNLIGNISNIFTQIGNIPVGSKCTVAADFGNLDLGDLNFCTGKENMPFVVTFGAYAFELIFVIGTGIILVKQLLGILDWSRQ